MLPSSFCKMRLLPSTYLGRYALLASLFSVSSSAGSKVPASRSANASESPLPPTHSTHRSQPYCSLAHSWREGRSQDCRWTFLTSPTQPCSALFLRPSPYPQCRRHDAPLSFVASLRQFCSEEGTTVNPTKEVDTAELVEMIESGDIQLIDVREPFELEQTGVIPRAVNIPLGDLDEALQMSEEEFHDRYMAPQPSKRDDNIVFHCRSGIRSEDAMTIAHLLGYTKARHYIRGFLGWNEFVTSIRGE